MVREMKILVSGGGGQLAWDVKRAGDNDAMAIIALPREELDIVDSQSIATAFLQYSPNIVINTAAYTAVDKAEQDVAAAFAINRDGAANIAMACARSKIPLIHISTDYVFDGEKHLPYKETDIAAPLNIYGESKLAGEEQVRHHCSNHIILRVSGVFGVHGKNFVKTILNLASKQDSLSVVADQVTCPTPAADIAEVVLTLVKSMSKNAWGTYHYCSSPPTTWFDFANAIINSAKRYQDFKLQALQKITTAEYPTLAKRPSNSVLDCEKIREAFGIQQKSWQEGLESVLREFFTIESPLPVQ